MSILDKLIVVLLALAIIPAAAAVVLITAGVISEELVLCGISALRGTYTYAALALVFVLAGIRVLFAFLGKRERTGLVTMQDKLGAVSVSYSTIRSLTKKVAAQSRAITDIKAGIKETAEGLLISISGKLAPESRIPDVVETLKEQVKEYIESTVGVNVSQVEVHIKDVADAANK